jgi:hypothetical protein
MNKLRKPNISVCYTPSSEPYSIYQRSHFRFPALPDFQRSSGSGTGSTQSREDNWEATWKDSGGSGLENEINGRGDSLPSIR